MTIIVTRQIHDERKPISIALKQLKLARSAMTPNVVYKKIRTPSTKPNYLTTGCSVLVANTGSLCGANKHATLIERQLKIHLPLVDKPSSNFLSQLGAKITTYISSDIDVLIFKSLYYSP